MRKILMQMPNPQTQEPKVKLSRRKKKLIKTLEGLILTYRQNDGDLKLNVFSIYENTINIQSPIKLQLTNRCIRRQLCSFFGFGVVHKNSVIIRPGNLMFFANKFRKLVNSPIIESFIEDYKGKIRPSSVVLPIIRERPTYKDAKAATEKFLNQPKSHIAYGRANLQESGIVEDFYPASEE